MYFDDLFPTVMPILRKKFNEEYWMAKESLILALGPISRGCASGMVDELQRVLDTNLHQKHFLLESRSTEHIVLLRPRAGL